MRVAVLRLLAPLFWIAAACAQIPSFQHVIVIVQENRTPDNLFHGLCVAPTPHSCSTTPTKDQYNIQTKNWLDKTSPTGVTQPSTAGLAAKYDLSHAHSAFVAMCDMDKTTRTCRNDGAAGVTCSQSCPTIPQFRYVDNSTGLVNPYLDLAEQYGWANYMFQTNQGPSFPAHQFLFGGTSAPSAADDAAGTFAAENMTNSGITGVATGAGCTVPAGTTVKLIDPTGENKEIYPCFEHQTMVDLLPPFVTWRYYTPNATSIWTAPNAIAHLCKSTGPGGKCTGTEWNENVDLTTAGVLKDIAACKLRSVSWVVPTGANSDHPDINDGGGPSWVASIVNAIGNSSSCDGDAGYWENTAIFIVWDDWGGFYDHEPPTILPGAQGDYQYGFRVPLVVVSAYTPPAFIDNTRHDFGSILRFIEHNFSLPMGGLDFADARATSDLVAFFDLTRKPRTYQTISAPLNAAFFINDKRPATDPDDY